MNTSTRKVLLAHSQAVWVWKLQLLEIFLMEETNICKYHYPGSDLNTAIYTSGRGHHSTGTDMVSLLAQKKAFILAAAAQSPCSLMCVVAASIPKTSVGRRGQLNTRQVREGPLLRSQKCSSSFDKNSIFQSNLVGSGNSHVRMCSFCSCCLFFF